MISVFYFSGTGNTAWAVRQLCDYLSERGEETKLYSIDIKECPGDEEILHIIKNSDIIGIANPNSIYLCKGKSRLDIVFKGEHMKVFYIANIVILMVNAKLISYSKTTVYYISRVYHLINTNAFSTNIRQLLT